jgi:hypothetical protein
VAKNFAEEANRYHGKLIPRLLLSSPEHFLARSKNIQEYMDIISTAQCDWLKHGPLCGRYIICCSDNGNGREWNTRGKG